MMRWIFPMGAKRYAPAREFVIRAPDSETAQWVYEHICRALDYRSTFEEW